MVHYNNSNKIIRALSVNILNFELTYFTIISTNKAI